MTESVSTSDEYRKGMYAFVEGRLADARELFQRCLTLCGEDKDERWVILSDLARVEHQAGNRELGSAYFTELISEDPKSPLSILCFAKSLLHHANAPAAALEQLERAKSLLNSSAYPADSQELPRSYYEEEFQRLSKELAASTR